MRPATTNSERVNALEWTHDLVVYLARIVGLSPWTRLCLRQADHLLLLRFASRCDQLALEPAMLELLQRIAPRRMDLALVQSEGAALPLRSAAALALGHADRVGMPCATELAGRQERLARLIMSKAVGLVLSGGGARGFAHVGVVRALREAGIPLDLVAGTSMGAIVAACLAVEWDDIELTKRLRRAFVEANPLRDYTLPFVALVRGRVMTSLLRDAFGDARIEDLWRPFCLLTNLSSGRAVVHREGPLWRALRASAAIPGVLPPLIEAGEALVDGGVINNLPVDVVRGLGCGPVIAVDVAADRALPRVPPELEDCSPWQWLVHGRRYVPRSPRC